MDLQQRPTWQLLLFILLLFGGYVLSRVLFGLVKIVLGATFFFLGVLVAGELVKRWQEPRR